MSKKRLVCHSDMFRSPIRESWTKVDNFRSPIWKVRKNWYVQISELNTPRCAAMTACVYGDTIAYRCSYRRTWHMPSWQLAYWRPQSLQHITGYLQSAKFADSDQLITNVTPLIWVSIYHHVTLSNILMISLNLSPTLSINPNTNCSPNVNKIIIINPTVLCIALVAPRVSLCTYTVTHSDRRSDNLGQKLIPSDQWSERCVKIDRFRSPIWTYNYRLVWTWTCGCIFVDTFSLFSAKL